MSAFVGGVTLSYQSHGPEDAPAIMLIAGLGEQLTRWPGDFVQALLAPGYRVICFDNRDAGLSSGFDTAETSDLRLIARSLLAGETLQLPYGLDHMADDAIALMEFLGISCAHLIGVSLGAMIAQLAAARRPEKVRSLTLVRTGTGDPAYLTPRPQVVMALMSLTAAASEESKAVARGLAFAQALAGPAYPVNSAQAEARLRAEYQRAYRPFGVMRQLGAALTQTDRTAILGKITAPTEIIHGSADPLLALEGAYKAAAAIPGAKLTVIEGMGHDFAPGLTDTVLEIFCRAAARAGI